MPGYLVVSSGVLAFLFSSAAALPRLAWHAPGNPGSHVLNILIIIFIKIWFLLEVFPAYGLSAYLSRVARRSRLELELLCRPRPS